MKKNRITTPTKIITDQYRKIFEAAPDGLMIIDLKTSRVVYANPAACMMHAYALQEIVGLNWKTFIHLKSRPGYKVNLKALQMDGVFDIRVLDLCQDGSTFPAEWRGTVFMFNDRACLLGFVRDVSKRIHAEKLLHESCSSSHP